MTALPASTFDIGTVLITLTSNEGSGDSAQLYRLTKPFAAHKQKEPGRVVQSVTCLATDACLTADPGVTSLIQARSHTGDFAESFKKGCCQLQAKVCAQSTG